MEDEEKVSRGGGGGNFFVFSFSFLFDHSGGTINSIYFLGTNTRNPHCAFKNKERKTAGFFVAQTEEPLEQIFLFNAYFDSRS